MTLPYIFNIQKFSLHDGPGIRTTVFFKGCPLCCLWCHNPESQSYQPEQMRAGREETAGRQYEAAELFRILAADQMFYDQSGGGVTFSGGEVMAQDMEYVEGVAKGLKAAGIPLAIDTSGYAPAENFLRVLPYADLFLYDLKLLDPGEHRKFTGRNNALILSNLVLLGERRAPVELRLMLVRGVNDSLSDMRAADAWLRENGVALKGISLLPYHNFGRDKYERLGRPCTQNFSPPDEGSIREAKEYFESAGYTVTIGGHYGNTTDQAALG